MPLPPGLAGPVEVMLARAVERIPDAGGLPGGARFELKWDGFRAIVARTDDRVTVRSRRGTDLSANFPEIVAAATAQLEPGTVLDGELVIWSAAGRLDFESLQQRMGRGARSAAALAREQPASLVAFDVLAADGQDLRPLPFDERRARLEDVAAAWRPPLNLSPITRDPQVAAEWFDTYTAAGIEGLVIKGGAQPYQPGARAWLKFKRRSLTDVVCGAVIGPRSAPHQLVAGLPIGGRLHIVGRTGPLSAGACRSLVPWLAPPTGDHPWPPRVPRAAFGRFNTAGDPVDLTLVEPVVVEVSADAAWNGTNFRHLLRFARVRPDIDVSSVRPPSG